MQKKYMRLVFHHFILKNGTVFLVNEIYRTSLYRSQRDFQQHNSEDRIVVWRFDGTTGRKLHQRRPQTVYSKQI